MKLATPAVGPLVPTKTGEEGPPATATPFSVNVTAPLVIAAWVLEFWTVAVTVTAAPVLERFGEPLTAVVVGVPVDAVKVSDPTFFLEMR